MQAHIMSLHKPLVPGVGSKDYFFLKVVMLHMKLKEKMCISSCKQNLGPYQTPLTSRVALKVIFLLVQKRIFDKVNLLAIKHS